MRRFVPILLACCLTFLSGCAVFFVSAMAKGKSPQLTIIAHRGASADAPENTLAAFRLATNSHANFFELDCRLTKDEKVVISHDADLKRIAGRKADVADLYLAEIQQLDAGSWFSSAFREERIPTFSQALDVATEDCGVYVEIKGERGDAAISEKLVERGMASDRLSKDLRAALLSLCDGGECRSSQLTRACIAEIRAHGMEKDVVIQSFSPLVCFIARIEAQDIRTELLISDAKDDPAHFERYVHFGMLIGVKGFNASKDSLTPERFARFKRAHKSVAVWTIDDEAEWRHFAEMGVDAIITNKPGECYSRMKSIR